MAVYFRDVVIVGDEATVRTQEFLYQPILERATDGRFRRVELASDDLNLETDVQIYVLRRGPQG